MPKVVRSSRATRRLHVLRQQFTIIRSTFIRWARRVQRPCHSQLRGSRITVRSSINLSAVIHTIYLHENMAMCILAGEINKIRLQTDTVTTNTHKSKYASAIKKRENIKNIKRYKCMSLVCTVHTRDVTAFEARMAEFRPRPWPHSTVLGLKVAASISHFRWLCVQLRKILF